MCVCFQLYMSERGLIWKAFLLSHGQHSDIYRYQELYFRKTTAKVVMTSQVSREHPLSLHYVEINQYQKIQNFKLFVLLFFCVCLFWTQQFSLEKYMSKETR